MCFFSIDGGKSEFRWEEKSFLFCFFSEMSEQLKVPLPRAESRRRGDEASNIGRQQLEAAETERCQPNNAGSPLKAEHRSVVIIKPSAPKKKKTQPRKMKKTLPPALVLALRVALTLAVLAVPAIFLQNSDRRRDPLVAAAVTLQCVSRSLVVVKKVFFLSAAFFFSCSTSTSTSRLPDFYITQQQQQQKSDRRPRPPDYVDPSRRHGLPPGSLRPSRSRRRRGARHRSLVRRRQGVEDGARRRGRGAGSGVGRVGGRDARDVPGRRGRRRRRRRRRLPGLQLREARAPAPGPGRELGRPRRRLPRFPRRDVGDRPAVGYGCVPEAGRGGAGRAGEDGEGRRRREVEV